MENDGFVNPKGTLFRKLGNHKKRTKEEQKDEKKNLSRWDKKNL